MKPVIDFEHKNIFGPALHISVPDFIRISKICSIFRKTLTKEDDILGEAHNFWEVVRVADGNVPIVVEEKSYYINPDEVFIYSPYTFHGGRECTSERTLEIFSFFSDSPFLDRLANRPFKLTDTQFQLFELIINKGKSFMGRFPWVLTKDRELIQPVEGHPLLQTLGNLIELFLIDLYETDLLPKAGESNADEFASQYQDERLKTLVQYFEDHIYETLTLEQISAENNIGSASLQKLCKKHFGCGPISYFLSMKIKKAKQMIAESSKNFSQITEELGFSSIHYFSNLFKTRTGVSPSAYAKAIRREQNRATARFFLLLEDRLYLFSV